MSLKKNIGKIHLWLGLVTGPIVFIVGLTGAIFVFRDEIEHLLQTNNYVKVEKKAVYLPPSRRIKLCETESPQHFAAAIEYPFDKGQAAVVMMEDTAGWWGSYTINQYTGEILRKIEPGSFNFFDWCIEGHRWLWLPSYEVGHTIVNYATLIFMASLISGLVLWWPKNKAAAQQRFRFKWKETTQWRRKNYDLHNILGFYTLLIGLILAITGVIIGTEWFANGFYFLTSGGETLKEVTAIYSDTTQQKSMDLKTAEDSVWAKFFPPSWNNFYMQLPRKDNNKALIVVSLGHDEYYFDQYTLKEIKIDHPLHVKMKDASVAAQLRHFNYEIHVGSIGGIGTKIIAFIASLIVASLPVTGFYIWWGRKKKSKQ